jgi:hypothetical protein
MRAVRIALVVAFLALAVYIIFPVFTRALRSDMGPFTDERLAALTASGALQRGPTSSSTSPPPIPRLLLMTYHSKDRIPPQVYEAIRTHAPEFELRIYDDQEGARFIREHFSPEVEAAFWRLQRAHRADLLRYCLLYVTGGVYLDVKTVINSPLGAIFPTHSHRIHSCISGLKPRTAYQGIIAAAPGHRFFLELIAFAVATPYWVTKVNYHVFTRDFSDRAARISFPHSSPSPPDIAPGDYGELFHFLEERCSFSGRDCGGNLDRYFRCCNVYTERGERVLGGRHPDFPW